MKKILVVLVFALVAIGLIMPKVIAPKYQQTVADLIATVNALPGYSAKIESTESAWFGTESKVLVGYDMAQIDPSSTVGKLQAELILDTHYGPLLFNQQGLFGWYSTTIRFQGDKQREFITWDKNKPLYQLSLLGGFTGNIQLVDKIPAFSDKTQAFQFNGYSGNGVKTANAFHYEGTITEINLKTLGLTMTTKDIGIATNVDADMASLFKNSLYNSNTKITLGKLDLGPIGKLEGVTFAVGTKLDEATQLGSISMDYLIKSLAFAGFKVSDLTLLTEFTHLNNDFFKKYDNFTSQAVAQTGSPDALSEELLTFMQDNIDELLVSKPEFNVTQFSGSMKEGRFDASLTSKFADMGSPTLEQFQMPNFWLYHLIAKADIKADVPLANNLTARFLAQQMQAPINSPEVTQQAQNIINHFIQQGFIKRENGKYLSNIQLEKGQAQVYDQRFPWL